MNGLKSDFDLWLDQMDSQQPTWWLNFAKPEELRDRMYVLTHTAARTPEEIKEQLREAVGRRLFVCIRAWVALEVCPMCKEPVVLARRDSEAAAERGAKTAGTTAGTEREPS